ncbi:hypothetical protein PIB30_094031 [Stylosanthes scabra]|uniref:Uncharacterized protein n=1 Tax=Stylosanthes scabra TaxID=79078 RepID=A0ABU6ZTY1_9FABA|nr:hypothetical protein [Stylosanthes scabra]
MNTTNPNYEWLSRKTLNHTLSRGRAGEINPVPKVLGSLLVRSGELAGARLALTPELTFDHTVARVRRATARCGQNPPEWLPRYGVIA